MKSQVIETLNGMAAQLQHAAFVAGGVIAVVAIVAFVSYWLVWRQ